jgi:RNA-directed DNA polymerase
VRVRHDEGLAIRVGPEPCAVPREGPGEASAGDGVPTNSRSLAAFRYHVTVLWHRPLRRRSQKDWSTWERISQLMAAYLPPARILHPWPEARFAVKHLKWEPGARIAPAGICAGAPGDGRPYRDSF